MLNARMIAPIELDQALAAALQEHFPAYQDMTISANVRLKPYQLPLLQRKAEDIVVKAVLPAGKPVSSVMYVPLTIWEDGVQTEELRCRFDVKIFAEVYHARQNFEKGQEFQKTDFYLKPADILKYKTTLADKNFNFEDKMIFSYIKVDEPLLTWKMRKRPLVLVGQTVTVRFIYDNITVKSQAKVLQQGYRGEQIRVRIVPSAKIYKAIVLDRENVEVKL